MTGWEFLGNACIVVSIIIIIYVIDAVFTEVRQS